MTPLAKVLLLTLPFLDYHKCFLVMFIDVYICIYIYTHIIHILYTYYTHIIYIYLDHLVVFCLVCPNITVGVGGLHDADPLYGSSVFHEVGRPLKLAWLGLFKKNGGYIYIYINWQNGLFNYGIYGIIMVIYGYYLFISG